MKAIATLRSWVRRTARRSTFEREMDEELRFHLDSYADDLVRSGVPRAEARRRAAAEFGGIEARKEDCRQAIGLRLLDDLGNDLRYATRQLKRSPAFTAVAVISLALGIGANTAIFSLMEAALWKSVRVSEPQQLRLFSWVSGPRAVMNSSSGNWSRSAAGSRASTSFSYPIYDAFRQGSPNFESVFAFKTIGRVTAVIDGGAELAAAQLVSENFFASLGVTPRFGRPITADDNTRDGGETVAVISDGFWARRFGRDPSAVGRTIRVNEVPVTIVGVNAAGFDGVEPSERPDLFMPLEKQPLVFPMRRGPSESLLDNPDYWWLQIMGRLKPEVGDTAAQTALDAALQQAVRATLPERMHRDQPRFRLLPGARGQDNLREEFARPLMVLGALVGLVLLIACANVATLLLARAAARRRELGLRLALGASRGRIGRQLLTEGLALGCGGGALGLALGYGVRDAIPSLLVPSWQIELQLQADFDLRVVALAIGMTLATSIGFSLAPIWQTVRGDVNPTLKDGGRSAIAANPLRARSLVVLQVVVSVVLLVGAGLFVRTLWNLRSVDIGFRPERIVLFTVDPPRAKYAGSARKGLFAKLHEAIAALPGVESASLSESPLVAGGSSRTRVGPDGRPPGPNDEASVNDVGARFFETMGIPIVAGRSFDAHDREGAPPVTVVSERFVKEFFAGQNPIGRMVRNNDILYRIVGVCGDVRFTRARLPAPPLFYRPFTQAANEPGSLTFEVRTALDGTAIVNSVRQAVRSIDRDLPIYNLRTQRAQIDATIARERLFVMLTVAFGGLALVLSATGIYGTVAHSVARRTSEIGIRLALGADPGRVRLMVLREASSPAAAGAVIGLAAAAVLTRYVQAMLFGVTPLDPLTLSAAAAIMLGVAMLSGWLPARRASRLDPIVALRHD
jgi:predicted permease